MAVVATLVIAAGGMMNNIFQVGDLIRYRDRIPTDPQPLGDGRDGWGEMGIVVKIVYWNDDSEHPDALEVVTPIGDNMLVKMADVAILS